MKLLSKDRSGRGSKQHNINKKIKIIIFKKWFSLGLFELHSIEDTTKELEKQAGLLTSQAITRFVKGNII